MPYFRYHARDQRNKICKGILEATDAKQLRLRLREQQLLLIDAKLSKSQIPKVPLPQLLPWVMQLSQLLQSGLPLWESLCVLQKEESGGALHSITVTLAEKVREGMSLAQGMRLFPKTFDKRFTAMIEAAQASGALGTTMQKLATWLQEQLRFKKQWVGALIYPALLMGVACIVILVLLFFVIPSLEPLLAGETKGLTAIVLASSRLAREQGLWILFGGGFLFIFFLWSAKRQQGERWRRLLAKIPAVKMLWVKMALVRFFSTMSHLQESGVPFVEAFAISRQALGHPLLEPLFANMEKRLLQGERLSQLLSQYPLLPQAAVHLVAIGEQASCLTQSMRQIANLYEEQTGQVLMRWSQLIQPVVLLFLAFFVGLVLLAMLIPLTQSSALMGTGP